MSLTGGASYIEANRGKSVDIIIPTRNSAKTIASCLESIKKQTYENIRTLVIDAFSSDNTAEIALKFNYETYLFDGERSLAKNFGISKATGEYLLFLDSDMILQPHVVEECVKKCSESNKIAGVIVPERSIGSQFWVSVRDFERSMYFGSRIESARFFVKEYVTKVKGFDEDIIYYEENTLSQRLENIGMTTDARIKSFILHNEEGFNLRKWLFKKRYYSLSAEKYSTKYERVANMQMSVVYRLRIFLRSDNRGKLLRHPLLSMGVMILKTLEFLATRRILMSGHSDVIRRPG